jgi:hypothetical protein
VRTTRDIHSSWAKGEKAGKKTGSEIKIKIKGKKEILR